MKDNGFKLAKERSGRYLAQTITNADYADDIAPLANTLALTETLLHSLDRAAVGIGLHVNTDKMEYMRFNQRGDISTLLNDSFLKPVDKFTCLRSSVSSTDKDINTRHQQVHLPKKQCFIYRQRHQHATSTSSPT